MDINYIIDKNKQKLGISFESVIDEDGMIVPKGFDALKQLRWEIASGQHDSQISLYLRQEAERK